ncbi:putative PEP-CTERM system histidine kinase [Pseudoduganella flava]|uniref:histidine kinase n=1 Tax=Pseudoduganella flava TaxID=871742 RepID=A0A562PNR8_9BURK|nr:XrtA/PEP-CTERM system histidine kinase PrsK [Pseudoduganella flava]QGZ40562.1 PEP-CTERM system histidine kinase PrsK [Pseudoduganella flava]TWI46008.1 putative PEP-CTERM system histidine kinase [Pseudoduganella flava]
MPVSTASFSYASAALAFALLCVPLLTRWRGRPHTRLLAAACAAMVLWSGAMIALAAGVLSALPAELLELARGAAWTAVLFAMLGLRPAGTIVRFSAGLYVALLALVIAEPALPHHVGFQLAVAGRMGAAVLGMLLIEQLYRNAGTQGRWAIKFACLGIGGIFAYDFYMYSDMLLFRELNPELWAARGVVNALTAPLLALALLRSASWSSHFAVSRRMLFHSAALIGSAVYLLAMSSAAYYLRFVGGEWGSLMQLAFLFGASMLLAGVLFSGSFRAWLKVFISKHFYRYNYDYREEWLSFTRTLSHPGPGLGERTIQALAALVESPGGALWLRRGSRCEPAAQWQTAPAAACEPADSPFCTFIERRQWVVDLGEQAPPDAQLPAQLPAWLHAFPRAWLVVPLILHGRLLGFTVLQRPRSAVALNWEVLDLLKVAGTQAASYLAQQEADTALMLARQFDSFNRLSTFVVHDLKNLVAQLSLLTANAEKHRDNPEFQRDMQDTVSYSVQKMKLMLQKLSRSATPEHARPLAVDQVLTQAVALKSAFEPRPTLQVDQAGLLVLADAERLERVLGHLIQNAIEATPKDGKVAVRLNGSADAVCIEIADTGQGMSAEFVRERLFKPFDSTKSAGMGIGAFESREYIHELGGRLDVRSEPLHGTTFTVSLPLYRADAISQAA